MNDKSTIELKVREVLTDANLDRRQAEDILKLWRENCRSSYDAVSKTSTAVIFLALVFTLLSTASLSEVSVFGLKFKQVDVPLLILHVSCSFLFYRAVTTYAFAQLVGEAIREADYQLYKSWQTKGLLDLVMPPAPIEIEQALANIEDTGSFFERVANAWGVLLVFLSCLGVGGWFYWSCKVLYSSASIPAPLSIAAIVVCGLFLLRAIFAFAHFLHRGA